MLLQTANQFKATITDLERRLAEAQGKRGSREKVNLTRQNILLERRAADAEAEAARLREALKFYADPENYDESQAPGTFVCDGGDYGGSDEWETDEGRIAREALADSGGQKGADDGSPS